MGLPAKLVRSQLNFFKPFVANCSLETTRSVAAEVPYDANAMTRLAEDACRLLAGMEIPKGGVRLLGLAVGSPAQRDDGQPSLFEGLEA